MDLILNERKLPYPNNVTVTNPKNAGHLLIVWDRVINPDEDTVSSTPTQVPYVTAVKYNVYRSTSIGGIFYKLNDSPLDQPRFNDANVNRNPNTQYFYKVSTVAVLNDGTTSEGETSPPVMFQTPTMNKWFVKINERNMWILKNTGVLMDFYKRKTEGQRCPKCWNDLRGQGDPDCTVCFGVGFVGGYEPMFQIYVRQKPAVQQLELQSQGYVINNTPGAWTISPVQLMNRDLLINPQGIIFSITSNNTNHAAGYLFHQELTLKELDPTDRRYEIKRHTLYPFV